MKTYIGTKIINAAPMTRQAYNDLRGWTVPADENPADDGYLVEYLDGGQANVPGHTGYVSWSPKDVFERAYKGNGHLTFGDALVAIKNGKKLARTSWQQNGSCIYMALAAKPPKSDAEPTNIFGTQLTACLAIKIDDRSEVWEPSNDDCLSEDWEILP